MGSKRSSDHKPKANKRKKALYSSTKDIPVANAPTQSLPISTPLPSTTQPVPPHSAPIPPPTQPLSSPPTSYATINMRECHGKQLNKEYEEFVAEKYGMYIWSISDCYGKGDFGAKVVGLCLSGVLRADGYRHCSGKFMGSAECCLPCTGVFNTVKSAKFRWDKQKKNHTTASTERDPFQFLNLGKKAKGYLRNLKETVKEQAATINDQDKQIKKLLNRKSELLNKDSRVLIELLYSVLESNRLQADSFMYKFFLQQLQCLSQEDACAWRWDPTIVHWAMTLQYHGGELVIDSLREQSTQGNKY